MPRLDPVHCVPLALSPELIQALSYLRNALMAADAVGVGEWEFACQMPNLRTAGITETTLRLLVEQGLTEHRHETTTHEQNFRTFTSSPNLRFTEASCFVIRREAAATGLPMAIEPPFCLNPSTAGRNGHVPRFDRASRTLLFAGQIVKQFRVPAHNQELILCAFEEEHWPQHLDDPLPPTQDIEAKKRIHDAIYRLNSNQKNRLLLFTGDGTGQGINWRPIDDRSPVD